MTIVELVVVSSRSPLATVTHAAGFGDGDDIPGRGRRKAEYDRAPG